MIGKCVRVMFPFPAVSGVPGRPAVVLSNPDARGDIDLVMITRREPPQAGIEILATDYLGDAFSNRAWVRVARPLRMHHSKVSPLRVSVSLDFVGRLRKQLIKDDTREYSKLTHAANRPGSDPARTAFSPGQTIPYAGRVFTEDEVEAAVSSTLDFWLTLGPEGEAFEKELAAFLGVKHSLLVNSGSSANLVAISALTSHKLPAHKRIQPGDEVITVAAGFPTTVAPILQVGAVPVFIDAKPLTGNADCSQLEAAYCSGKTKAVMLAHALGNPFDLSAVLAFCQRHDLWLIEDNCDALGCTYSLPLDEAKALGLEHLIKIAEKGEHPIIRVNAETLKEESLDAEGLDEDDERGAGDASFQHSSATASQLYLTAPTGSFGDLSTQSFYPPHHLTMGEGGAVNIVRRVSLKTYAESFRDWGRDCWCPSGKDNTCAKRFQWQLGELPEGYDHKYIYSHLGYNLKPLDPQAAIGRVQLRRLPDFIEARKRNWEQLRRGLHGLEACIDFALPTHATVWQASGSQRLEVRGQEAEVSSHFTWDASGCRTDCSWFGFMMTIREDAPFTRTELAAHLDQHKIGNRMLFGGNLVRQPAFVQLKRDRPDAFRVVAAVAADCGSLPVDSGMAVSCQTAQSPPLATPASPLPGADHIMNHTLFLGTYPGLTSGQIDYIVQVIRHFVQAKLES